MQRRRWGWIGLTLFAALGCQRGTPPAAAPTATPTATPAPVATPAAPKVLRYAMETEPGYIDPGLTNEMNGVHVAMALFEGLLIKNPVKNTIEPGVAERWNVSPDGLQYTFYLRNTARWTDGTPVTAHDFAYAWERVLNPATASEYAFALFYLKNGKAYNGGTLKDASQLGFRATDDYTLQVTLEAPTGYMMELFTFWTYAPVPRKAVEQHGGQWTLPGKIISNGPFRLTAWEPNKIISAEKNPTYWDAAAVKLDRIDFIPVEDKETALRLYETGALDVLPGLPELKIPQLLGRPDVLFYPYLANDYLVFNTTRPFFADKRVRQALTMALDRVSLCDNYLQKIKKPLSGFVPPGTGDYVSPPGLPYDPVRAKALLAEAGYSDPTKIGSIELRYNTDPILKQMAQVVQRMWKENLGIDVTLVNEEYKTHLKVINMMQYDVGRRRWIGDYTDPNTYLELMTTQSTMNQTGWGNADYDRLLEQAGREPDRTKRLQYLHDAEKILLESAPILPMYVHNKAMMLRPTVHGIVPDMVDQHPFKYVTIQ